jgi:hypothetical protein
MRCPAILLTFGAGIASATLAIGGLLGTDGGVASEPSESRSPPLRSGMYSIQVQVGRFDLPPQEYRSPANGDPQPLTNYRREMATRFREDFVTRTRSIPSVCVAPRDAMRDQQGWIGAGRTMFGASDTCNSTDITNQNGRVSGTCAEEQSGSIASVTRFEGEFQQDRAEIRYTATSRLIAGSAPPSVLEMQVSFTRVGDCAG